MLWPALLLALAASAAESPCRPFGAGCYYAPDSALEASMPALLVYFRGHWGQYAGSVPEGKRLASARQAFEVFGLKKLAEDQGMVVLVTGSSDAAFTNADLAELERELEGGFKRLFLASHSGGYVGLWNSLSKLARPDRVVMLDNFYFAEGLSKLVAERVDKGTECAGFFTKHNKLRYEKNFKPYASCSVEARDDYGHDGAVSKCLPKFLAGEACK